MKECANCSSTEIVRNLKTNQVFCIDCKSTRVYGKCYRCGNVIKEEGCDLNGDDNWHMKNKLGENRGSCWEEHEIDEAVEADCS